MKDRMTIAQIERFWNKVDVQGPDDCWRWKGWKTSCGYGRFDLGREKVLATHIAMELSGFPRPLPPNDNALHGDCSDPSCCNPRHLRWGTKKENAEDRDRLKRREALRGERHPAARLCAEDVQDIRRSDLRPQELAPLYAVTPTLIRRIRNRQVWAHVP